jgi:uncharacterized protein (DUF2236 family)
MTPGDVPTPDHGLYGPDSVTWKVHGDPAMALGGLRAVMLQALHPLAMAAVAQHSDYRADPWGRLSRTADYVRTVTYGTTAQAQRAAARVRTIHARLSGVEPESATPYRVDDPALLLWVHCAEVDSFLAAYRCCGGRLRRGEADAYVAEQVKGAALVGVEPDGCPTSVAELREYFCAVRPQLRATAEAHRALQFVLFPPMPLPARPVWMTVASTAFGLLPAWARAQYGLPGLLMANPGVSLAATVNGRLLRGILRLVPDHIRASTSRAALGHLSA